MKRLVFAAALVLAAVVLVPALAQAEEMQCETGVVCLPPTDIEVRPPRPSAFYVLNRGRLEHQRVQNQQDFRQELIDSVRRNPF